MLLLWTCFHKFKDFSDEFLILWHGVQLMNVVLEQAMNHSSDALGQVPCSYLFCVLFSFLLCCFGKLLKSVLKSRTFRTSQFWNGLTDLGQGMGRAVHLSGGPRGQPVLLPSAASPDPCSFGVWFPDCAQASGIGLNANEYPSNSLLSQSLFWSPCLLSGFHWTP